MIIKGNTTQDAKLAVLYDIEPPIRINILTDLEAMGAMQWNVIFWWLMYRLFINFTVLIVNINEYQTTVE